MRRAVKKAFGSAPAFNKHIELFWTRYPRNKYFGCESTHHNLIIEVSCRLSVGQELLKNAVDRLGGSPELPERGKVENTGGVGGGTMNLGDWRNASAMDSLYQL